MECAKFEVGKAYSGWCSRGDGVPRLVVAIAPDRSYLMATYPQGRDPFCARRLEIVNDPRFGEKVVERGYGTSVWRADKPWRDMEVPEGWYDGDARDRSNSAKEAAKTRSDKKALSTIRDGMTMERFAKAYSALVAKEHPNEDVPASDWWHDLFAKNGATMELGKVSKGKHGAYFGAVVQYVDETRRVHSFSLTVRLGVVAFGRTEVSGDEFNAIFGK